MIDAFRSEFEQKMDAKGRVSVPADFVRVLKAGDPAVPADKPRPGVVLVYGGNKPCIQGYTIEAMNRITLSIAKMQNSDPRKALLQRSYATLSVQVDVGDDGRIVLPPKARAQIGLGEGKDGGDTVFAGTLDKFEIWHKPAYEADVWGLQARAQMLIPAGADISSLLPDFVADA